MLLQLVLYCVLFVCTAVLFENRRRTRELIPPYICLYLAEQLRGKDTNRGLGDDIDKDWTTTTRTQTCDGCVTGCNHPTAKTDGMC